MLFSKETACFKIFDSPLLEVSKQRLHAVKAADIVVVGSYSGLDDFQGDFQSLYFRDQGAMPNYLMIQSSNF